MGQCKSRYRRADATQALIVEASSTSTAHATMPAPIVEAPATRARVHGATPWGGIFSELVVSVMQETCDTQEEIHNLQTLRDECRDFIEFNAHRIEYAEARARVEGREARLREGGA